MKLSTIKEILARNDLQLTRSLGQNFLHDANQLRRIVAAADLKNGDRVLEIGPGLGPLTELLVAKAGTVLAIEKDERLFQFLRGHFRGTKNLQLLREDALKYLRQRRDDWSQWKVVSNLPYSVASPILVELAQCEKSPGRIVATVQLEVAQRLMARAGDKDYGLLTLLVQVSYEPREWFKISASCFFPEPDVDSACVTLIGRSPPLADAEQAVTFAGVVKRSFSQRRKMMLKLLKEDWPADVLEARFEQLGLSAKVRAENVSLEQFVKLSQLLHNLSK
jgi:16S rRNA (adenine1518-N6/adenine1519-N6)-dimethyltransferase